MSPGISRLFPPGVLGVVAALPAEAAAFGCRRVRPGTIVTPSPGVLLVVSGMGPGRARAAGQQLLAAGAGTLLAWGCAGALDEDLAPGSLLLPEALIAGGKTLMIDPHRHSHLYEHLANSGFAIATGALVESPIAVTGVADKRALRQRSGVLAVDMESGALGRLAQEAGVPFVVLRVIADGAATPIPSWISGTVDALGRPVFPQFMVELLKHPQDWPALMRLALTFRTACATLTAVAACLNGEYRAPRTTSPVL